MTRAAMLQDPSLPIASRHWQWTCQCHSRSTRWTCCQRVRRHALSGFLAMPPFMRHKYSPGDSLYHCQPQPESLTAGDSLNGLSDELGFTRSCDNCTGSSFVRYTHPYILAVLFINGNCTLDYVGTSLFRQPSSTFCFISQALQNSKLWAEAQANLVKLMCLILPRRL